MATLLMSVFCGALSYAQQDQRFKMTPEERTGKRVERMKKSLDLTDEQAAKLQEVHKQLLVEMKQIRAKGEVNREEMRAKTEAYHAQIKTILTPEQYQKYREQRKVMHKKIQKERQSEHQKGQHKNRKSKNADES